MSLQVWLPLDGDLKNRGLDSLNELTTHSVTYADGKFAKCLNLNGVKSASGTFSSLKGLRVYSFCCWLKVDATNIGDYKDMLIVGSCHDGNKGNIRIEHTAAVGAFQIIYNKSSTSITVAPATVPFFLTIGSKVNFRNLYKFFHLTICSLATKYICFGNAAPTSTGS